MSSEGGVITIIVLAGLILGYAAVTVFFNRKKKINDLEETRNSLLSVEEQV